MATVSTTTTEPTFGKKIVDGAAWGIGFGITSFFVGALLKWATTKSEDKPERDEYDEIDELDDE